MKDVTVGDKVRVIDARPYGEFRYKNGDIFYVSNVWDNGYGIDVGGGMELTNHEFEVVEDFSVESASERLATASNAMGYSLSDIVTDSPNGKLLRVYAGQGVTVGVDEALGVMYVLGMKTEVSE